MANLYIAFQSLPDNIKEWLGDENVALEISEINNKLSINLLDDRSGVIPHLILRLCVQDIEPRNFINELSHKLNLSFESAKILTKEIEEKILKPIEAPLKIDVGVDLKLLYFANPNMVSRESRIENLESRTIETPPAIIPEPEVSKPINSTLPLKAKDAPQSVSNVESPGKPFILHNEEPIAQQKTPPVTQPSFSYKTPLNQTPTKPTPPPRAQIQTPPPSIQRVVHYSGFFTKLFSEKNQEKKSTVPLPKSKWFI